MKDLTPFFSRLRAAGIHLLICLAVAALAAALVFGLWYPWPYRVAAGGQGLFVLVVSVDLILGPLLTLTVFNVAKTRSHLRRDLAVIRALQLAALVYGLSTVYAARPVALVFEVDRFRVVNAANVHAPELPQAPEAFRRLPLTGPWLLGTRKAQPGEESNDALFKGLEGLDLGQRPKFWQAYELSRSAALARARPVALLVQHYPARKDEILAVLRDAGVALEAARFLPMLARQDWVVMLNAQGNPAGLVALDGFF